MRILDKNNWAKGVLRGLLLLLEKEGITDTAFPDMVEPFGTRLPQAERNGPAVQQAFHLTTNRFPGFRHERCHSFTQPAEPALCGSVLLNNIGSVKRR